MKPGHSKMTTQDRQLIDRWMLEIEARMFELSMRCQDRARGGK
jgi:hypothetical protein